MKRTPVKSSRRKLAQSSPLKKGNMNSPARRPLADISNTPPSAKKVKHFTESLPVIKVIIILTF